MALNLKWTKCVWESLNVLIHLIQLLMALYKEYNGVQTFATVTLKCFITLNLIENVGYIGFHNDCAF